MTARPTSVGARTAKDAGSLPDVSSGGRPWSLRSRLTWLATVTTLIAWLAGGIGVMVAAYNEGEALYDEQLREVAQVVLSFATHELDEIRQDGRDDNVHIETAATLHSRYAYQIWSKNGELLLVSHNAARKPYAPLDRPGFVDVDIDGRPFCIYSLRSADGGMLIQVAEDESLRSLMRMGLTLWEVFFFVVSIVLLTILNRWVFGRAVHELDQSAAQLTDRSPYDLRPVRIDNPPRELEPLLGSINSLFRRIQRTLDAERSFTAAAAHELRTPLVAVRMQAQAALRAPTRSEASASLSDLVACTDRASGMVDQLLLLARLDNLLVKSAVFVPVQLDRVIEHVVADLRHALEERKVSVDMQLARATIPAIEFAVAALVRNLIDNAIQHASCGGQVAVRTEVGQGEVSMIVEDAGPGIAESERERVFERFYRLTDSETKGCGVGLSIVQCVAIAHQAKVTLGSAIRGGLSVTVVFPAVRK